MRKILSYCVVVIAVLIGCDIIAAEELGSETTVPDSLAIEGTFVRVDDLMFTFDNGGEFGLSTKTGKVTITPADMPMDSVAVYFWKAVETRFWTENERLRERMEELETENRRLRDRIDFLIIPPMGWQLPQREIDELVATFKVEYQQLVDKVREQVRDRMREQGGVEDD